MHPTSLALLAALSWIPLACSGQAPIDADPIGSNLSDYAGSWDGHAEAYSFRFGGSDHVRVVIDAEGEGTIEFGDAPLLPPPTNPDVAYPLPWTDPDFIMFRSPRDGFQYPIHGASLEARRLRLTVSRLDLFAAWCQMQSPVETSPGVYQCAKPAAAITIPPPGGSDCGLTYADGAMATMDCGRYMLCGEAHVCACTSSGCDGWGVDDPAGWSIRIDAALEDDGAELVGNLQPDSDTRVTVRLARN